MQDQIINYLNSPEQNRDEAWEKKFLNLFPSAKFTLKDPSPQQGPDGFPYLLITIDEKSKDPITHLLNWTHDKGIGLVLNPHKTLPDYVFNYGSLWVFKEFGKLNVSEIDYGLKSQSEKFEAGKPSTKILPTVVQSLIKAFLLEQGVYSPKFLLISNKDKGVEFVFSIESLGSPPESEHEGILQALSWFLPPNYSLAMASEKSVPNMILL